MRSIYLIHWNETEAKSKAKTLSAFGYTVNFEPFDRSSFQRAKAQPPHAFVIDLSRLPSHGREVALSLRQALATRHVPLVFVDGDREKVVRIKGLLPDATYTSWKGIKSALERAIASQPTKPVIPASVFAPYSGTPLPKKLGLKPGITVGLIDAPPEFEKLLGQLPEGTKMVRNPSRECDLIMLFAKTQMFLERGLRRALRLMREDAGLWIAWPKQASGKRSELTQYHVRHLGLSSGLVDYKVCAIDQTWSGLRFTRRKAK